MKNVLMFHFAACPYCRRAIKWMDELKQEYPEFCDVPVELVDERLNPERSNQYNYYYVPTFFIDAKKVHEGTASKEIVEKVFREAMA